MLLRVLFVAILVYFIVRAISRLIAAMRQDQGGRGGGGIFPGASGNRGGGSGSNKRATRDELHEDIEDARWTDL